MHYTTRRFWEYYNTLPENVQMTADRCYELLKVAPAHPSLHFKKVGKYWSVRVGRNYRALGVEVKNGISWFWIGTHAEYNYRPLHLFILKLQLSKVLHLDAWF